MRSLRRTTTAVALGALTAALTGTVAGASGAATPSAPDANRLQITRAVQGAGATAAAPARQRLLVPHAAAYARAKAAANSAATARASASSRRAGPRPLAPVVTRNWAGQFDSFSAPSDSTGAIGTTRYVELVNRRFGIYSRTSNVPLSSGTLTTLMACGGNCFDPQVIWDPGTNRFFYAADDIVSSTNNRLLFGFSKTGSPNTSADWCKYSLGYGSLFPDYPKLGDTANFGLLGVNVFSGNSYVRSDAIAITKPAAGTTCPGLSAFVKQGLLNANGSKAATPVPANQTDTSTTGYIISRGSSNSLLSVFRVTRNTTTGAPIFGAGANVAVTAFSVPASAPQPGTTRKLDTLDARLTQAVSAVDPRLGQLGLWTQHTVFGGAGAKVRWYEINPATRVVLQTGTVAGVSGGKYIFNGAVSPDRRANGTSRLFGANMVLHYNTSSTTTLPNISSASKVGGAALTIGPVIATSAGADTGFDCASGVCRWGDYAAATPDPASSTTLTVGQVWGTSQLGSSSTNTAIADWRTQNFALRP